MRIAYVSLHWPRTPHDGVGKKIAGQLRAWRDEGHEARLFMHLPAGSLAEDLLPAELFAYSARGRLRTEISRIAAAARLVRALRSYMPDVIYLRYGIYTFPIHRLATIAPTVEEVNTDDRVQHEDLGRTYARYNRLTRGLLLRRVAGLIIVSRELAASPAFAVYGRPTRVIANGIDLRAFDLLSAPLNNAPRMAFIGTPGFIWHGVDKLVEFARRFPEIRLDIIGYHSLAEFEPLPANITLHGYLESDAYLRVLASADAAVSSLALHRIGLQEASPLKSRECLALGIPLIMAYHDTDLQDVEAPFLLRIPNREDNILTDGARMRDFVHEMRGRRVDRAMIASIDDRPKERERLEFFRQIVEGAAA